MQQTPIAHVTHNVVSTEWPRDAVEGLLKMTSRCPNAQRNLMMTSLLDLFRTPNIPYDERSPTLGDAMPEKVNAGARSSWQFSCLGLSLLLWIFFEPREGPQSNNDASSRYSIFFEPQALMWRTISAEGDAMPEKGNAGTRLDKTFKIKNYELLLGGVKDLLPIASGANPIQTPRQNMFLWKLVTGFSIHCRRKSL
jgi:hypothetical protein